MAGVNSRTSCRQLFKKLNILTLSLLHILEVTCFIRKYCQSLELNANVHNHNTRRKMDIHIKSYRTNSYKNSVINMETKICNKLPDHMKEIDSYKSFKKKLKPFPLLHTFYSVEEFLSSWFYIHKYVNVAECYEYSIFYWLLSVTIIKYSYWKLICIVLKICK
jgi:hypothetical protein